MKKIALIIMSFCLSSCLYGADIDKHWRFHERNTECRHSDKFNSCFCVFITAANNTGIAFAPDITCGGEEDGAIPR